MVIEAPTRGPRTAEQAGHKLPSLEVAQTFNTAGDYLSILWRNHTSRNITPMLPFRPAAGTTDLYPVNLALTRQLIQNVGETEQREGRSIDSQELFDLALDETSHTPNPEFTWDAINNFTVVFFRTGEAFTTAGIANYFTVNKPVQEALAHTIEQSGEKEKPIKVKELSTGGRPRWKLVADALQPDTKLDITLTDFDLSVLPTDEELAALDTPNITFTKGVHNALEPMPNLPEDERFDVMLKTYGFDSVWHPKDARYTKIGEDWYTSSFRLKSPEGIVKEQELIEALKDPSTSEKFPLQDLAGIAIEEVVQPIEPTEIPYFDTISKRYEAFNAAQINFPGGLIHSVQEVFETQLKDNGTFIIGDVATIDLPEDTTQDLYRSSYLESGGEKYKVEDYGLARDILIQEGFDVQLMTANQFTGETDENTHDGQVVMIVRKPQPQTS